MPSTESVIPTSDAPVRAPRGLRAAGVVFVLAAIGLVALGLTQRASGSDALKTRTAEQAIPTVTLVKPKPLSAGGGLQLPGRLEAIASASLYGRANGYLKAWYVDIGAHVKAGQLMAEIETPDLDQQLQQSRADLVGAQAAAELSGITARRWQGMRGSNAVSQQEIDEKTGDYSAKQALVNSAKAKVDQLLATQGFRRIVAPFEGVVTARNTDVGALIGTGGGGQPLFQVADTRRLRAYVQVPQSLAPSVKAGQKATLTVPEYPGRSFDATIEGSSRAVSVASGAMLVQMSVANADGALLPGGYADVRFAAPAAGGAAQGSSLPASVLIFDASGLHVAVLGADDKVAMRPVKIVRDLGKTVEIGPGLDASARVIDSPPEALVAGDTVRVAQAEPEKRAP